ncbi:MAG TPA: adenosine deaminase [Actinomycetota bacterium]|jgi:adenosine deaminase|nr:adenosine deaminase [Actinomycetota bacterium]
MPGPVTRDQVASLPLVLLHDHLDGGLRPETMVELADATGYRALPSDDPSSLAAWMTRGASRGDLVLYLETFVHTVGVMQSADALSRVARECVEDLAADGVVYAEVRFAPELHTEGGLPPDAVVEAVLDGFAAGSREAAIGIGTIVTAMRTGGRSLEIADLALRWADRGVVGFDLAGAEAGHPPTAHRAAFDRVLADGRLGLTIHAGEGDGLGSIRGALACGAQRIGHGVRLADDITIDGERPRLGPLAREVRDRGVPLEMCPTSNVHSGAASSIEAHPAGPMSDLGFSITINTDNRLMSATTESEELTRVARAFGWNLDRLERTAVTAAEAAFLPRRERRRLVEQVIRPRYAQARAGAGPETHGPP